jgi:hypothetical protein
LAPIAALASRIGRSGTESEEKTTMRPCALLVAAALIGTIQVAQSTEILTIAAVDNADMHRMQELTDNFAAAIPTSISTGCCWRKASCARRWQPISRRTAASSTS